MGAVFTVLFVLAVSLIVVRVATVGLTLTGLSRDLAHFQALSAFTGSGFTTRESEEIVKHPVRRRIVMHLMLMGNAGIVLAISSLLWSFLGPGGEQRWWSTLWFRMIALGVGCALLLILASSNYFEKLMWRVNSWAVKRWVGIEIRDYTGLLRIVRDYAVCELQVREGDWLEGRTLAQLELPREGVLILGIERASGKYIGAPRGKTMVEVGDSLVLYGRQETLIDLDDRRAGLEGNLHHVMAVTRQQDVQQHELGDEVTDGDGDSEKKGLQRDAGSEADATLR